MSLFMDVHSIEGGVSAGDVPRAHMKKSGGFPMKRFSTVVIAVALTMLLAAPVSNAQGGLEGVGERINILRQIPTTFDAGTPFHILHGPAGLVPGPDHPIGKYTFRLEVDGVDQGSGQLVNLVAGQENGLLRLFLFNFEDGLAAGEHTFVGHFSAPCATAVDQGFFPGPCPKKNESVEIDISQFGLPDTLVVTFS